MQHSFYSHAPRGARQSVGRRIRKTIRFYSHAPRGARPPAPELPSLLPQVSTHTPLAGRDDGVSASVRGRMVSTHTPLAGRDLRSGAKLFVPEGFYSHAPRGARLRQIDVDFDAFWFLLTRPSRGAT